jgi:hypothetical protein
MIATNKTTHLEKLEKNYIKKCQKSKTQKNKFFAGRILRITMVSKCRFSNNESKDRSFLSE